METYVDEMSIPAVVTELLRELGPTLIGEITGLRVASDAVFWVNTGLRPSAAEAERLRCALAVFRVVAAHEGGDRARSFMSADNPQLDGMSPVKAISRDRLNEALDAAYAHVEPKE